MASRKKLTEEQVLEIRRYIRGDYGSNWKSDAAIARRTGVSTATVHNIRKGKAHPYIRLP